VYAAHFSGGDDLVTMALAPSGPSYADLDIVQADWAAAKELGLRIFTHVGGGTREVETLDANGLLDARLTFVHGNSLPDDELARIAAAGAAVSIAPAVEAQMGHGAPMVGRLRHHGITTGLGVDVVTTVAGDMFALMRATLLTSQLGDGERLRAADVLRLATLDGATALGRADEIGSLRPGKQGDLVLLRADDVNLVGGRHDPIGTVVTNAHPGNVDAVFVAGQRVDTSLPAEVVADLVAAPPSR